MAWTKEDRVMAVLSGELPDRVPLLDLILNDAYYRRYNNGEDVRPGDQETVIRLASLNLDASHPADAPNEVRSEPAPFGNERRYERWTVWETPTPEKTQEDLIRAVQHDIDEYRDYRVSQQEIDDYKALAKKRREWAGDMLYPAYENKCPILPGTVEEGIYLYADEPELVKEWNRVMNRRRLLQFEAMVDGSDTKFMFNFNDAAFKNGPLWSPAVLDELLFPHLRRICETAHAKGIKVIYHTDGNLYMLMDRILACGIDGLHPMEVSAGMFYSEFKERYGKRVAMVGAMDGVYRLSGGTVDEVVEEAKRLCKIGGAGGGLIAASSTGQIDNSMPLQNLLAYFDTVRTYGKY